MHIRTNVDSESFGVNDSVEMRQTQIGVLNRTTTITQHNTATVESKRKE